MRHAEMSMTLRGSGSEIFAGLEFYRLFGMVISGRLGFRIAGKLEHEPLLGRVESLPTKLLFLPYPPLRAD